MPPPWAARCRCPTDRAPYVSPDATHYELRKIPRWRQVLFPLLAPVIVWLVRLYWRSCRVTQVIGAEHMDALAAEGKPIIPCYWHQKQMFCIYYLCHARVKDFRMGALVSPSRDGEVAALVLERLGVKPIRGSGTRTGAQAVRELYLAMKKDGVSPVMTPDGSQGPFHEFKHGPVMLSQLSGAPMVPVTYAPRRAWKLKNWDRHLIPYPFTRIVIAIGAPRVAPRSGKFGEESPLQAEMADALNEIEEIAEKAVRGG